MTPQTRTHLMLGLTLALLLSQVDCAGREIGIAQKTYNTTVPLLTEAYDRGEISPETQLNVIAPAREAAKAVLDEMVAAYLEGRDFDWRTSVRAFYAAFRPALRQRQILEASDGV